MRTEKLILETVPESKASEEEARASRDISFLPCLHLAQSENRWVQEGLTNLCGLGPQPPALLPPPGGEHFPWQEARENTQGGQEGSLSQ